jgi:hypothetical protein
MTNVALIDQRSRFPGPEITDERGGKHFARMIKAAKEISRRKLPAVA